MTEDIVVPVAFAAATILGIWLVSLFNFRKRLTMHETLRLAMDKGQPLSMDLLATMTQIVDPIRRDLRRGIVLIAIGIGIAVVGVIIGPEEGGTLRPVLGIASFPVILGVAYLGLWRFGHDRA